MNNQIVMIIKDKEVRVSACRSTTIGSIKAQAIAMGAEKCFLQFGNKLHQICEVYL